MKTKLRIFVAFALTACMLFGLLPFGADAEEEETMDVDFTVDIAAWEKVPQNKQITVFENLTDEIRVIKTDEYDLRSSQVFVFNGEGLMVEAGENLYGNKDGTYGSPQTEVFIPAHGFMAAFAGAVPVKMLTTYAFVFEGAMLYNSTMTVVRTIYGSYDKETARLRIRYNKSQPESENCKSFLFVGNSTTYFNGIPLKFRAMCAAAGIEVSVTYCTFGSAYLSEFADENHERGKALRKKLADRKYDYVVLQDAGGANYEDSKPALDIILPLVYENGAEPLLYMRYSSTSDDSARTDGAIRHYRNYTRLAKLYGLRCSPVAVAFEYCRTEHREINLYASDNSHHSKEGSYLAAATLMYSFFGVSPVGNSYTAYMPQEIVDVLQEEAAKAVETEFEAGAIKASVYKRKGVEYVNVAFEKPYTATGSAYNGNWTDTRADGTPMGKFTDGMKATSGSDSLCGCYVGKKQSVTVDLGEIYALVRVDADLFGGAWGIASVTDSKLTFELSLDGKNFYPADTTRRTSAVRDNGWDKCTFYTAPDEPEAARFVRVNCELGSDFSWISEIEAFAERKCDLSSAVNGAAAAANAASGNANG